MTTTMAAITPELMPLASVSAVVVTAAVSVALLPRATSLLKACKTPRTSGLRVPSWFMWMSVASFAGVFQASTMS